MFHWIKQHLAGIPQHAWGHWYTQGFTDGTAAGYAAGHIDGLKDSNIGPPPAAVDPSKREWDEYEDSYDEYPPDKYGPCSGDWWLAE